MPFAVAILVTRNADLEQKPEKMTPLIAKACALLA